MVRTIAIDGASAGGSSERGTGAEHANISMDA